MFCLACTFAKVEHTLKKVDLLPPLEHLERLEKVRQNVYEPLIFPENDLILPDLGHNKGIRRGSETKKIRQKRLFLNALKES